MGEETKEMPEISGGSTVMRMLLTAVAVVFMMFAKCAKAVMKSRVTKGVVVAGTRAYDSVHAGNGR